MSKKQALNPITIALGRRIRVRRIAKGISQENLGKLIGVSFQQVQKYERGATKLGYDRIVEIAQALDTTGQSLIDGLENSGLGNGKQADGAESHAFLTDQRAIRLAENFVLIRQREISNALFHLVRSLAENPEDT